MSEIKAVQANSIQSVMARAAQKMVEDGATIQINVSMPVETTADPEPDPDIETISVEGGVTLDEGDYGKMWRFEDGKGTDVWYNPTDICRLVFSRDDFGLGDMIEVKPARKWVTPKGVKCGIRVFVMIDDLECDA